VSTEVDKVKLKQWAGLIRSANASGLERKVWFKQNGISASSFYYWQRRVRKYALDVMADKNESETSLAFPQNQTKEQPSSSDFYEISLGGSYAHPKPDTCANNSGGLTIRYGNFSVEVNEGFSTELLASVVRVLGHV